MIIENLYDPFSISIEKLESYPRKEEQHNYFELIYILSGRGKIYINQNYFDYQKDHLFLISPSESHFFEIETFSIFFRISFYHVYIDPGDLHTYHIDNLKIILRNSNHKIGSVLKTNIDKALVKAIVNAIIREISKKELYSRELVKQLVNTLIVVVARNLAHSVSEAVEEDAEERIVLILNYIQKNIYNPNKLRSCALSKQFNISANYLGRYFKKHCNETLQAYISNCKLSLIEQRLVHSDKRINEIVSEFGFIDESHLNRFFKKFKGLSPTKYRNSFKTPDL